MNQLLSKIGIASTTSVVLTEAIGVDSIMNALISLVVSIISVLAVEGISLLKTYLTAKKNKIDIKSKEE